MKLFRILLLIHFLSMTVYGQQMDSIRINHDTICFTTPNAFYFNHQNYETFNNSFITGSSFAVIRSQDNPRIYVDGIPMNPMIFTNTHYTDYLGGMNLLSYDIEKVMIKTLAHESRINAGQYNNSMDFKTFDVKPGKTKSQFEVNHFTAFTYQDIENRGYSTLTNVNVQQGFKKFGYRASFSNGYMNDYLPENGLQRYSGNVKLNYQPFKAISLAGFIDYSNFKDFKREADHLDETMNSDVIPGYTFFNGSGKNTLKATRLFAYINADLTLAKGMTVYGKWAQVNTGDHAERYIFFNWDNFDGPSYIGNYEYNDCKDRSTYSDIGFRWIHPIKKNGLINFNIGYSINDHHYDRNQENYNFIGEGFRSPYNTKPVTIEKVFYTSLKISTKSLSVQYLFNRNNYHGEQIFLWRGDENRTFNNHLLSANLDVIKSDRKLVNQLGAQLNLGKLINYAILYPPDYTKYANDNIEFIIHSSYFNNRLDLNLSFYQKEYGTYDHLFQFKSPYGGTEIYLEDLGKVTKRGYELNGSALLIKSKKLDWLLAFSYSGNSEELSDHKNFGLVLADTIITNKLISVANNLRYKGFHIGVELEQKEGYDINMFQNNLSVAEPLPYWKREQITGVDNEGIPTIEQINNSLHYITSADYLILKHIGCEYELRRRSNHIGYVFGVQYDKMRRLYLFVNDADVNYNQFQRPSFYHSLSLSFKMRF